MKVLAFDTSGDSGSVAIIDEDRLLYEKIWFPQAGHTIELPSQIQNACVESNTLLSQIDAFAVTIGPGSFTGVRVGLSFLKGMTLTQLKPIVVVSTLLVLAHSVSEEGLICPLLDARREEVFFALYRHIPNQYQSVFEEAAESPKKVFSRLSEEISSFSETIFFLGSGVRKYPVPIELFSETQIKILPTSYDTIKASVLARIGLQKIRKGEFVQEADLLNPEYRRASEAELRLKKA